MSEVLTLEELLVGRVVRNDEEGTAKLSRADFEENLGDDCDMAMVKRVEHKLATYRAAATGALGRVQMEMLVGDPGRDYIDGSAEYGTQSKLTNRVSRCHTVGKGDKRKDFYGHSKVVVSNGNEPDLLAAIESIGRRGQDLFGGSK